MFEARSSAPPAQQPVLKILGESAEALGVLEEALVTESNRWIRATVAKDTGRLGRPALPLIPALRRALQDNNRDVRHEAANALAKLEGLRQADPRDLFPTFRK